MKWRYSLRWKRPAPCPDEPELASEVVEAGSPCLSPLCHCGWWAPGMRFAWFFCMTGRSKAGEVT